jgi:DNA-binding protein H-NS
LLQSWQPLGRPREAGSLIAAGLYLSQVLAVYLVIDVLEITMANLKRMNVEALLSLRNQIDRRLADLRTELEKQLAALDGQPKRKARSSALRGRKVPPKYRSPSGETWAGRGARPKWMVEALKSGKKLDDFLIDRSARKGRKKRRAKR